MDRPGGFCLSYHKERPVAPTPTIPKEQRSFADRGAQAPDAATPVDRRDRETGVQTPAPGDADVSLKQEGRFGNLTQNMTSRSLVHNR